MPIIQGIAFPEELLIKLIDDVREKKELGPVERNIVRELLVKELQSNKKLVIFLAEHELRTVDRASKYKELLKVVRAKLRKAYGMFQIEGERDKWEALEDLKKAIAKKHNLEVTEGLHRELLKTHLSSKERLGYYDDIYAQIWKITGKPRSIIDIGCGINPLSFPFMRLNKVDYYASEMNTQDVNFLNEYFDIMEEFGLYGKAVQQDLRDIITNPYLFGVFPRSDVCFMFKLFDSVKVLGKPKTIDEKLIEKIPAKFVVASFSTQTIGARSMKVVKRDWVEKLCLRQGWTFKKFEIENEVFYVIDKHGVVI